jgi:hypothetical protein
MKTLIAFAISVFAAASFAMTTSAAAPAGFDYAGHWTGTGSMHDNSGWSANCSNMQADIALSGNSLSFKSDFKCDGGIESTQGPMTLQISGNNLIYQGHNYGTISAQAIHVKLPDVGGTSFQWDIEKTSTNQIKYSDRAVYKSGWMETDGSLKR